MQAMKFQSKRFLLLVVAVLLLAALFGVFFHHHNDGNDHHPDCSVCHFVKHISIIFGLFVVLIAGIFCQEFSQVPSFDFNPLLLSSQFTSRAPPALS